MEIVIGSVLNLLSKKKKKKKCLNLELTEVSKFYLFVFAVDNWI